MTIDTVVQQDAIATPYIELFIIDLTNLGGGIYRFTNSNPPTGSSTISFGGNAYTPMPIAATGFESKNDGSQARPTIQVSNVEGVLLTAIIGLGDIVGGKVTRLRTFGQFLDSGSTPDSTQTLPPDVFYIEQKVSQNKQVVTWQLCSALEKNQVRLPRRQITRTNFPGAGRTRLR
jgi:lambda family phage minor tail protein L